MRTKTRLNRSKKFVMFLDSGAFSFFNKFHRGVPTAKLADYHKTSMFRTYLKKYVKFLHKYKTRLGFYITLDVISNPKETWAILKYLESEGLNPLPVYHAKSDTAWLYKIMDNYEHFCIGGLGKGDRNSIRQNIECLDNVFSIVCDKKGNPAAKIHGLAMTGVSAAKWPWDSVDSITWRYHSAMGQLNVPSIGSNGELDFLHYRFLVVSDSRIMARSHFLRQVPIVRAALEDYFKSLGFTYSKLAVCYKARATVNAVTFYKWGQAVRKLWSLRLQKDWLGGQMIFAGSPFTSKVNYEILRKAMEVGKMQTVYGLETFWCNEFSGKRQKAESVFEKIEKGYV